MAKKLSAKARAAARKQRDKWKNKRWFTIRAPRHPWNFKRIGETIGETDEHIMGRVYEMTQQEFSGDFTKMHVILRFRVTEVVNDMLGNTLKNAGFAIFSTGGFTTAASDGQFINLGQV